MLLRVAPEFRPIANTSGVVVEVFVMRSSPSLMVMVFQDFVWLVFTVTIEPLLMVSVSPADHEIGGATSATHDADTTDRVVHSMPSGDVAQPDVEPCAKVAKRFRPGQYAMHVHGSEVGSTDSVQVMPSVEYAARVEPWATATNRPPPKVTRQLPAAPGNVVVFQVAPLSVEYVALVEPYETATHVPLAPPTSPQQTERQSPATLRVVDDHVVPLVEMAA